MRPARLRGPATLRARLVIGSTALIATALAVTFAVAALVGPPLFRDHIQQGQALPSDVLDRAEQAYHVANLLEVLLAVFLALVLAVVGSVVITRTISRRISAMAAAAARLADGDYATRLTGDPANKELDTLVTAFNRMADKIQQTEFTRRRLLTDVAHELRTPLSTLDGYLEAIEDGVETADADTLDLLRGQVNRLTRLADDIAAVSAADERRIRLELRDVRVDALVQQAAQAARPAYVEAGVQLDSVAAADCAITADAARLGQVLANLLSNALRHTPAGGRVTVTTSAAPAVVEITVNDTGEGVAPQHLPHLFERFYRAHPVSDHAVQGSGVGLTISRAILAAHGGTISVSSTGPGKGTSVRIVLPRGSAGRRRVEAIE